MSTKISALTPGTTPTGTEKLPAVQGGVTISLTVAQILSLASGLSTAIAYNTASAFTAYGDSVTTGTGSVTPATDGYIPLLATARVLTATNSAVSGDQAADQVKLINGLTVADGTQSTLLIGLNDTRQYGTDRYKLTAFKRAHMAALAWLAIPDAYKQKAQGSSISYSGTWTNDTANGNIGKNTSGGIAGTATATVYGTTIYIGTILNGTGTANFTVTVDGRLVGTWSCIPGATITTQNAQAYVGQLIRIPGLTEDNHTVLITVPSGNSAPVFLDWVAGNMGGPNKDGPNVFVGNLYRLNSTGYAVAPANSSDALIALANQMIRQNVEALASDGLSVTLVDICSRFSVTSHLNADGVHPNNAGHIIIRDAFREAMNQIGRNSVRHREKSQPVPINFQTGTTYTLDIVDQGKEIRGNNAASQTYTMDVNDKCSFDLLSTGSIRQVGAGLITLSPASGVVLNIPTGYLAQTARQGSVMAWHKVGPNEFDITGDLHV